MRRSPLRRAIAAAAAASCLISGIATGAPIFALANGNQLLRIDDLAPGIVVDSVAITGLQGAETLHAIDFRPATEQLYGLGSSNRLYTIDQRTGVATAVLGADGVTAGPISTPLSGTLFGFDFNPVVDRIRVVSDADQNLRLHPSDGVAPAAIDTPLAYNAADPNVGDDPIVSAVAYTNNFNGSSMTTLFGIDTGNDVLVSQVPPNNGTLNTIGSLGVDATGVAGFDIAHNLPTRVVLAVGGAMRLYLVNVNNGTVLEIGPFAQAVSSVAFPPQGFAAEVSGDAVTFTGSTASQSIRFDQTGGLLRHDRYGRGDAGFASDFDFDSATPGDQTISASGTATIRVEGGSGDDTVTIGQVASPAGSVSVSFVVDGGGGHDLVVIDDSASVVPRDYVLDADTVGGVFGGLANTSVESVEILAGGGADGFSIGSTTASTTLRGGGGADRFVVADDGGVQGGLVDGGPGLDTIDYSAWRTDPTFEATAAHELYLGRMSGAQEPGPLSSSPAVGHVVATLSPDASALAFRIPYSGLTGAPISGAHFHNAKAGINGPIERGLDSAEMNGSVTPAGTFLGNWTADNAEPLGATELAQLRAGRIYFNLHTLPNFPSGEIRGQLVPQDGLVGLASGAGGVRNVEVLDVTLFADGFE